MSDILAALGVDPSEFSWQDIASCSRIHDPDLFFETYESDPEIAKTVDELCLSCPVADKCLLDGLNHKEYGVWGGFYLTKGEVDEYRNAHKTEEVIERLREKHGL